MRPNGFAHKVDRDEDIPSSAEEEWRREARARQGEHQGKGAGVVLVRRLIY
jgi:hypothetical protein